ncbi:P-loop containing nucleoside triphosphate hydrolase protein [Rhexocercosporidium sp. MPI-PUGE-AT-0058]|nr:P-loop containing nucleoside triphosphate hydrolase protein [Rhexocercosporidium sp. MPI-PUGE-AT-0058]
MGDHIPPEEETNEAGVGLGDQDTVNKLQFIERLHAIGVASYMDLPQLVVVGDQNSGKSSVLQAITQLPFPVNENLCTRFATEVSLRRSPGPESIAVRIKRPDTRQSESLDVSEFNAAFGSPEFKTQFANMLTRASHQILGPQINIQELTDTTLHITVNTPTQINLTIVDLPGLVSRSHPSSEKARTLVNRYIVNPRSTILAIAVPLDPDTQEVFQIIRNVPDRETRVIGVINKCDRRQEGADHWILDAIKNDRRLATRHFLSRGWYGLRNRLPSESDTTNEERDRVEREFFAHGVWRELNQPTKLGISNLRSALTGMHNAQIARTIPLLIPEIRTQLESCKTRLSQLGQPRTSQREQRDCMIALASSFTKLSTDALDGQYHHLSDDSSARVRMNVRESLDEFYRDMQWAYEDSLPELPSNILTSLNENLWRHSILQDASLHHIESVSRENRGLEFADEVNPHVPRVLWASETDNWLPTATSCVDNIVNHLQTSISVLIQQATPDADLQRKSTEWLARALEDTSQLAHEELAKIAEDVWQRWTLSPRYMSLRGSMYNKYITNMARDLVSLTPDRAATISERERENQVTVWLARNGDVNAVLEIHCRLRTYYDIAMTRFVDNVGMQVVERHLLGSKSPLRMFTPTYVINKAEDDPDWLATIASENEERTIERDAISQEIATYEEALVEAQRHGYLRPGNN